MIYINAETNELYPSDIDIYNIGVPTQENLNVVYKYNEIKPEQGEYVVVAEYPETGGQDVEWKITSPGIGEWEMFDEEGNKLDYPIEEDLSLLNKQEPAYATITITKIRNFTQEELDQQEKDQKEYEKLMAEAEKRERVLNALPTRVDEVETTQDDVVLLLADIVGGAI